jgi:hypothetical protein
MAKYIVAIVLLAVIAGPAFAQGRQTEPSPMEAAEQQRKKDALKIDQQYNAAMKNGDKAPAPVRTDPWQNMRGANEPNAKR